MSKTVDPMLESAVRELHRRGGWAVKVRDDTTARLIATYRGRSLALEFRPPGSAPTRSQTQELAHAAKAGAIAAVIRSSQDLERLLDRIDSQPTTRRAA